MGSLLGSDEEKDGTFIPDRDGRLNTNEDDEGTPDRVGVLAMSKLSDADEDDGMRVIR